MQHSSSRVCRTGRTGVVLLRLAAAMLLLTVVTVALQLMAMAVMLLTGTL
jgi:hypothetical protein